MERFLYVFRGGMKDHEPTERTSQEEFDKVMIKWSQWTKELKAKDCLEGGEPLHSGGHTVFERGEVITDGPFAEGTEIVAGFLIVKAKTFAEAVETSKTCPIFDYPGSSVEVRRLV